MEELLKIIKLWWVNFKILFRPCVSIHISSSSVILSGPCLIYGAIISGEGAAADSQIYDGINAQTELKAHLEALSGTTFNWHHSHPCLFNLGMYVVVNASTTHVTITYKPLSYAEVKFLT